mmetsp:Transcript_24752/g.31683  ORF Transcript_24752/g.31683 Transcript_24752/m.31683 type:complete len:84 (-) Transcript_24752:42-293(-)
MKEKYETRTSSYKKLRIYTEVPSKTLELRTKLRNYPKCLCTSRSTHTSTNHLCYVYVGVAASCFALQQFMKQSMQELLESAIE